MKKKIIAFMISISCFAVFFCQPNIASGDSGEKKIRAKIGMQLKSGERITRATSRDRLKPGDLVRLYVHAEEGCFIYIIHTDQKEVNLLNITQQKIQSSTLILPSAQAFYEIDGKSSVEKFTIICSPEKLPRISDMENRPVAYGQWKEMETAFIEKSRLILPDKSRESFAIAGNVRGINDGGTGDTFVRNLRIFSGRGLLVKTYEFQIKK